MEDIILNGQETTHTSTPEQTVSFKKLSDKYFISVKDADGNTVVSLSGYGIEFGFDFKYIKTAEDIEAVSHSIANVVMQVITDAALNAAKTSKADTEE